MPEEFQRKLAAILAADIAGYSALMEANEEATVRDLKAHQAVVLPLICQARCHRYAQAITNGPAAQRGTYVGSFRSGIGNSSDFNFGGSGAGGVAAALMVWNTIA